ncbi:MAG: hypothetical protein MUF51_07990, partial [Vicinamibacteria bacterium]|nr:hypothetical protein [Vicinamibacteria bacterium]
KLSNRGIDRPRYLTPLYTIIAVALGVACVALARRALVWAALLLAAAIALNLHGTYPWLRERAAAHDRALDVTDRLYDLGVRRGYTRYWVAAKYTYLSRAKMLLVGELGPEISWVHPRYRQEVRQADSFILDGKALAEALAARLDALQVRYQREDLHEMTVFCNLSRPVALSEVKGYESASDADGALESADEN